MSAQAALTGASIGAAVLAASRVRTANLGSRGSVTSRSGSPTIESVERWVSSAGVDPAASYRRLGRAGAGVVAVAVATVFVTIWWFLGWIGGGVVFAGAIVAGVLVLYSRQGRTEERYDDGLPHALDQVGRCLRSGSSLAQALDLAAETAQPIVGEDLRWLARGGDGSALEERLRRWPDRRPVRSVRLIAVALSLGHRSGSGLADSIEAAATSLRTRLALQGEIKVQAAQARASAVLIGGAPVGFLAFASALDPAVGRFLLDATSGRAALVVGVGLDSIAAFQLIRLTNWRRVA